MRNQPKAGPHEPTPEWIQVMWFDKAIPAWLWARLQSMPASEFMPLISDDGMNCSLFVNTQNPEGKMRSWSSRYAGPGQPNRKLDSDVMSHAFANYSDRSKQKDTLLQRLIDGKDQYLGRPPVWGRNLLGDSTCSAYSSIEGADFLMGYNVMRGWCAHSESNKVGSALGIKPSRPVD